MEGLLKYIEKYLLLSVAVGGVAFCAHYTGSFVGGKYFKNYAPIYYIAQSELMALEKERISLLPPQERTLFFGRIEEALKLVENEQKKRNDSKEKEIVLLSEGKLFGENVHSISREVHAELVKQLGSKKEQ